MSMLPADIHKRLDPELVAVRTHDDFGFPVIFMLDGVRVQYAPRKVVETWRRMQRESFGALFGYFLDDAS